MIEVNIGVVKGNGYREMKADFEAKLFTFLLRENASKKRVDLARELGMSPRQLHQKINKLGMYKQESRK